MGRHGQLQVAQLQPDLGRVLPWIPSQETELEEIKRGVEEPSDIYFMIFTHCTMNTNTYISK